MDMDIKITKNKIIIVAIIMVVISCLAFGVYWFLCLQKAHSTFEDYYHFRGCTELLSKTDSYGFCKTANNQIIKIVNFRGKWYLEGDLPCGFLCF